MVKGEDAVRRKKNKLNRKKAHRKESSSSKVSARVAAVIAAKKRRVTGKRSMCQGMCFSLPTPENPFNDKKSKMDTNRKETKKVVPSRAGGRASANGNGFPTRKKAPGGNHANLESGEHTMIENLNLVNNRAISSDKRSVTSINNRGHNKKTRAISSQQEKSFKNSGCPSKFLMLCLNSIQNQLQNGETSSEEDGDPLFVNTWGLEFWNYYSAGKDVLETSGTCSTTEQMAWMASTAADTIARKEKEGQSVTSPFLLFLVPSQEKAIKVRSVCKPLKSLGIHTVSLHTGASIDHQIHGLKSCEPEFLVSTPERLLELLILKAIDISGVSLLVVDGLDSFLKGGCLDAIKPIRQAISGDPYTVVFNDCLNNASVPFLQNLFHGPVFRLSINPSLASQSACIIQSVHVCAQKEEKLIKGVQILDDACGDESTCQPLKVLYIVSKDSVHQLVSAIKSKGYSVSANISCSNSQVLNSNKKAAVLVLDTEHVSRTEIGDFEVVLFSDCTESMDKYMNVVTRMARCSVKGSVHSILSREEASVAGGPLVAVLEECGQAIPKALRKLSK